MAKRATPRPKQARIIPNGSKDGRIEKFKHEYLKDMNGTQAAIRAGYAPAWANRQATYILGIKKHKDDIEKMLAERRERLSITTDAVLREVYRIATSDPAGLFNNKGQLLAIPDMPEGIRKAISGVDVVTKKRPGSNDPADVEYVSKIRLWDKGKQLELLGKHLKLWQDHVQVEIHADVDSLSDGQLAEVARQLAARAGFDLRAAENGGTSGGKKD